MLICICGTATVNLNHGTGGDANDRDVIKDDFGRPLIFETDNLFLKYILLLKLNPDGIFSVNRRMSMPHNKARKSKDGKWIFSGYAFEDDDVAHQMAYLFAGNEGQNRAKKIRLESEKITDPAERQKYIEEQVKIKASEVDEGFRDGLTDIISKLPTSGKDLSGPEAGKDIAVGLMKSLGLNVDPDNVQTHYSPGPPTCFQISWVDRPTKEVSNINSEISQLSKCYGESLSTNPKAQEDFNAKWDQHVTNAKNDGPKIDKTKFEMDSAKSWSDFKGQAKKEYEQDIKPKSTDDLSSDEQKTFHPK